MPFVLVRSGGNIASGVASRLHQVGFPVMISELPMLLAVRRRVCFASAVYKNGSGEKNIYRGNGTDGFL